MTTVGPDDGIAQFARIQAALQDAIPLHEALEAESLDAAAWASLRLEAVPAIAADGTTFSLYQAELERAQDNNHRPIEPLFDDAVAWLAYLEALERSGATDRFLEAHALTVADLARLERHWRGRLLASPKDARAAKDEVQQMGDELGLPPLIIGERAAPPPPSSAPGTNPDPELASDAPRGSPVASRSYLPPPVEPLPPEPRAPMAASRAISARPSVR
ncbi:MAG: hypothetical protein AAGA56_29290, partial [Myxococcota bacterium]